MSHLKIAVERGYSDKARVQGAAFRILKDREEYQKLLADLPAKESSF